MTPLQRVLYLLVTGLTVLVFGATALVAQQTSPPGAIAWTQCLGGRVNTYIDVAVLGTDSTEEILYHESIHHRQNTDSIAKTGVCAMVVSPAQLLNYEIEAYCASDSVHVRVKHSTPSEASAQTIWRLLREFHGALPVFTVTDSWARGCPT
jgi:hypothetical protein